jgi:hypothetical protein
MRKITHAIKKSNPPKKLSQSPLDKLDAIKKAADTINRYQPQR